MEQRVINPGIFLFILLLISSCDNIDQIDGLVLDKKTNKPIDSALVYVKINGRLIDSFSCIHDSLTIAQRKALIKQVGNSENWTETGAGRMIRHIPTFTDSSGQFNIYFPVGYFPRYELFLQKTGYETLRISNKQINRDQSPKVFKMKKKTSSSIL